LSTAPYTHIDKLYIDGRWESTTGSEAVLNPATEAAIGQAPVGDAAAARGGAAAGGPPR
jgi:aldehyde dehydrogenase (NAD+)